MGKSTSDFTQCKCSIGWAQGEPESSVTQVNSGPPKPNQSLRKASC